MAYQGAYGNTAMPQQTDGGHWYDILSKLRSGLKGAGQGIGQGAGAVGQGAAWALSSIGPQLPEILKILGSIGKGVGQTATMVGRQLPYAGPLVQAGEYGILNAVGKEDSPWAQGNAFIQWDKEQEAWEKMTELARLGKGLANTQTEQVNEQNKWELSQNPMKERDTLLGIQNKEQELQKGKIDIESAQTRLASDKEALARLEAIAKDYPYSQQVQDLIKEAKAKIASEEALATQRLSYAGKNQRWEPSGGRNNIPSWIETSAKEYAKTHTAGLNPLTIDIAGIPQNLQVAFDATYKKKFDELLNTYNRQKSVSGGWSIIPQGGASTSMSGNADVQAGGTAGAPGVDEQVQLFWEKVQGEGMDPQDLLGLFITDGTLDPSKPDEAEVIRQIKEQMGAMAK